MRNFLEENESNNEMNGCKKNLCNLSRKNVFSKVMCTIQGKSGEGPMMYKVEITINVERIANQCQRESLC